ncbi:MAG TPA: tetratricopeptide repeat protein [Pyrinomonadaceae bacterium]|nr:tetratricopeptide repeat protein [Pyrinomonadaceae bacterium]
MLKRNVPGLSLVLLTLFVVVRVAAQGIPQGAASTDTGFGGVNSISGMIVSSTGQRIQRRVSVRLRTMTRGDRVSTTDEYGNFVFRGLPSGDFVVVIDKEQDFEPFSQNVSVIQPRGMPPQTYHLSIRLELKGRPEARPGVLNAEFANVPKPALVHYNNAADQAKKKNHQGAIEQLKLAIQEYPSFTLAFNELGVQYLKLNQLEKADEAFQDALKITPDSFAALINRGIANVMLKRYGEAIPILRKALKKNDQSAVGHYFLGQALANSGLFEQAEKELLASLELGKEQMKEAHRLLAIIYSSRGAKKQAADELEAYLKLAPNTSDAEQLRETIRKLKESNE